MTRNRLQIPSIVILAVLAAGCHDDTFVEPEETSGGAATALEMAELVVDTEALVGDMVESEIDGREAATTGAGPGGTIVVDVAFSRTRSCPLGGEVAIEGEMHDTFETATFTRETTLGGTKTITQCSFRKHGQTVTVDGGAEWDAFRRRVAGHPDGLQTASYAGSITAVREDGTTRSCEFSVEAVRDPDAHTRTVTVSICGNTFTRTVSWEPRGGGS